MKYASYTDYRETQLEWAGPIPAHWQIKKIGHLTLLKSGENIVSEEIAQGGEYPVFGGNGFRGYFNQYTHDGDFVLIGRQGALCGNINYVSGKFWASEHALVAHSLAEFDIHWFGETLRAMNLNQYSVSAAQPGLAASAISALRVPFPPVDEQQAIARFLDAKTAQIDTLVAKKRELIAKLKEKRSALIARTVTRGLPPEAALAAGLEPNTEMKDSGVEWLGETPAHWQLLPLFRIAEAIQTGPFGSQLHQADYVEDEVPLINPIHLVDGELSPDAKNTITPETAERLARYSLRIGDIVFARRGEIGRCAVVQAGQQGWVCGTGSMVVRLRGVDSNYFSLVFRSSGFSSLLELNAVGTTMLNLNPAIVGRMQVPVPPLHEQQANMAYLDRETAKLDLLTAKVEAAIIRLTEYRQALITSAVTGKIDVREATA